MIPPFVISLDLEIDIHGEPTEERNPPDGLATGDRPDELSGWSLRGTTYAYPSGRR